MLEKREAGTVAGLTVNSVLLPSGEGLRFLI